MKKNIKLPTKNCCLTFNLKFLLLGTLCLCFSSLAAQRIEKVYSSELAVDEETEVFSKGVDAIKFYGNGTISFWDDRKGASFSGKEKDGPIYQIDKHLVISTWDKQIVKQVTTLVIECETEQQTAALISELKIDLALDVVSKINVDANLNIAAIEVNNGWFKSDESFLLLDDGRRFPIKYFSIKNELYMPKNQNLRLQLESNSVSLGDHEGQLEIKAKDALFNAGALNELDANFIDSEVNIKSVEKAEIVSKKSEVNILKSDKLSMKSISSNIHSTKIKALEVTTSLNDTYELDRIDEAVIYEAKFSDFNIEFLEKQLRSSLKNCGVAVSQFGPEFKALLIINENAEMQLNVAALMDYKVICRSYGQAKYLGLDGYDDAKVTDSVAEFTKGDIDKVLVDLDCKFCKVKLGTNF